MRVTRDGAVWHISLDALTCAANDR
ncbi:hypothetical protein SBRY_20214 [Actinacidiphila bryophytorum]|uniref:Uncharacterized protein n=1 Tax=Actinacidiphila bryophytorum TaxID=1436133 RepID=A0A9W4E9H2_9ACTN|nr:hypothetical protein SBRY_20214 [Actinacidiphila bryophytorum]